MPATTTTGQVVRMDVNDQAPVLGRSEIEITQTLDSTLQSGLRHLKTEAERRARG